ncbi:exodeoxyribonuclease VII small subunit [Hahella sp. HN01]|uniref:exodeoxyribonuclease VII small subunit n=1 Tax=Hahella sp. HN01 TaxID=2847262 RepID=UPI001C1ECF2B|nr:exodeoxyribonuclease VII small subunit [Hahella sp. HN01]MBU6951828.1 exodeoxyribonuclease VII small subunit [Hahella sp. HN01]
MTEKNANPDVSPATSGSTPDFEDALQRLEVLVRKLEQGDLKLEEALVAFEEGVQLTRHCQTALQTAEQKVQQLIEERGTPLTKPFDQNDAED